MRVPTPHTPPPGGQRLDVALKSLRENEAKKTGDANSTSASETPTISDGEFRAVMRKSGQGGGQHDSLDTLISDLTMPIITDASIFQQGRTVFLLEYLRDTLLPGLGEGEELATLANQIIEDEIARHTLISGKRQEGIAA